MKFSSFFGQLLIVFLLTMTTQVGGFIWLLYLLLARIFPKRNTRYYKLFTFPILYLLFTFLIIPPTAKQFGRTPLPISKASSLIPHNYFTVLLNRHYVTPKLKSELLAISKDFQKSNSILKTVYLDANFPFWDGFPLLPHLSHNDGRKIDLSFIYSKDGKLTNTKPSRSGYGYYEPPKKGETNQPNKCSKSGNWQYSFPQYLTLGSKKNLSFEASKTKELIDQILKRKYTQKVFVEPHLKERLGISHNKLRYHGCQAVRHDDHIHYQIK